MKIYDIDEFNNTVKEVEDDAELSKFIDLTLHEKERILNDTIESLDNPVAVQKEVLARMKIALDEKMKTEMNTEGNLSNMSRVWINDLMAHLNSLQNNMYGRKSINVNIDNDSVSHGQIANKIRQIRNKKSDN